MRIGVDEPSIEDTVAILRGLAKDGSSASGAVLLRAISLGYPETEVEAALDGLAVGRHEAVRKHLPRLLEAALFSPLPDFFPPTGQPRLVELAARMRVEEAAPVLAKLLLDDTELDWPRGIARALGEIGGPEHAGALLAVANDPARDVYFRREAILALGRIAPARLDEIAAEPCLELAFAAARYRNERSDDARGRILTGLGREHETDDAARLCVELFIREAAPAMEEFLARNKDHYAAAAVRKALETLTGRGRG